jgi:hypothetical protein
MYEMPLALVVSRRLWGVLKDEVFDTGGEGEETTFWPPLIFHALGFAGMVQLRVSRAVSVPMHI